ncbi:MAG: hypothetical protein CYG59_01840 [Chloroflexi bacterium]|nr:MAG: hypothetical protein CYG59_01840 [Chloroflexota bacterium]
MPNRILLVEADPDLRTLLQDVLAEEGYEMVTVAMPVVASADVAALGLDAIVLEYSVRQQLRARQMLNVMQVCVATMTIPFIISTTAVTAAEELAGLLRPQCDALLSKPFAIDDLLLAVGRSVGAVQGRLAV